MTCASSANSETTLFVSPHKFLGLIQVCSSCSMSFSKGRTGTAGSLPSHITVNCPISVGVKWKGRPVIFGDISPFLKSSSHILTRGSALNLILLFMVIYRNLVVWGYIEIVKNLRYRVLDCCYGLYNHFKFIA